VQVSDLDLPGWNPRWQRVFEPYAERGLAPGRVVVEHRDLYGVATAAGEMNGELAGRLRHEAEQRSDLPAVGDFVALRLPDGEGPALIQAVLPRQTVFVRKAAGEALDGQVIAANIDTVFVMMALDHDFNPRRLERYLAVVWEGGANPIVLLNKADLSADRDASLARLRQVASGVAIHMISALAGEGLEALEPYLGRGLTVGFVGSSGVGKSTLLNQLLGREAQATRGVRASDSRGRHTTTHRQLFVLPGGGIVIDTPGMRELQLWKAEEGVETVFADIDALAADCRFADCRHRSEPGCAVRGAVEAGELGADRLAAYEKLLRELRHTESRLDPSAALERKRRDRLGSKAMKFFKSR
jgi:ribosome biogenesis GTPase / thiamine phosphate phosphatase